MKGNFPTLGSKRSGPLIKHVLNIDLDLTCQLAKNVHVSPNRIPAPAAKHSKTAKKQPNKYVLLYTI